MTPLQLRWIEDLRSTRKQTKSCLMSDDGFCCLGVALVRTLGVQPQTRVDNLHGLHQTSIGIFENDLMAVLPLPYTNRLGLHTSNGDFEFEKVSSAWKTEVVGATSLTELNDTLDWSLNKIADFIEANPEAVFTHA